MSSSVFATSPLPLPAEPLADGNETLAAVVAEATSGASQAAQWVAAAFALGIFLIITSVYRSFGLKVQLVLLTYITSLFSTQLAVKAAVQRFPFPMLVTALHFASTWLATSIFFRLGMGERRALPVLATLRNWTLSEGVCIWLSNILYLGPVACALAGSVALNNAALMYINVSLNAVIGIATPLATAVIAAACGAQFAPLAWLGIVVAAFGDVIAAGTGLRAAMRSRTAAAALGVCCSVGAMLLRATKSVMQERLMGRSQRQASVEKDDDDHKAVSVGSNASAPLEPMQLVALQAPLLTGVAMLLMAAVEGPRGLSALCALTPGAAALMLLSCAAATSMNFSQMCAISMLGAPAAQLAGKLNVFITTALATVCFDEVLTPGEVCGAALALAGLAVYEKAQKHHRSGEEKKHADSAASFGRCSSASIPSAGAGRRAVSVLTRRQLRSSAMNFPMQIV
mmetsp:Transcript_10801/g.20071  ORF Transcript_10801/g.20071 Transcript_10801/m.20071 type:complete len:456 (+) Transcript_10801:66-1433(+)